MVEKLLTEIAELQEDVESLDQLRPDETRHIKKKIWQHINLWVGNGIPENNPAGV